MKSLFSTIKNSSGEIVNLPTICELKPEMIENELKKISFVSGKKVIKTVTVRSYKKPNNRGE